MNACRCRCLREMNRAGSAWEVCACALLSSVICHGAPHECTCAADIGELTPQGTVRLLDRRDNLRLTASGAPLQDRVQDLLPCRPSAGAPPHTSSVQLWRLRCCASSQHPAAGELLALDALETTYRRGLVHDLWISGVSWCATAILTAPCGPCKLCRLPAAHHDSCSQRSLVQLLKLSFYFLPSAHRLCLQQSPHQGSGGCLRARADCSPAAGAAGEDRWHLCPAVQQRRGEADAAAAAGHHRQGSQAEGAASSASRTLAQPAALSCSEHCCACWQLIAPTTAVHRKLAVLSSERP